MSRVKQLETLIENWLKPLPHLPNDIQKWIANNVWWITLVAAFGSAIATLMALSGIFAYMSFVGNASNYVGFYAVSSYATGWIWSAVVSLAFLAISTVLLSKAVTPLKEHRRWGWDLMFIILLIGAAQAFLSAVFSFSFFEFIFGVIFSALGLTISAWLLFGIRSYFVKSVKTNNTKQ